MSGVAMKLMNMATRTPAFRNIHQSAALLKAKPQPVVKPAAVQPKIEADWTPPEFPAEVKPAAPFVDSKGVKWNVRVAPCLFRYPRITPDLTKEEAEYSHFRERVSAHFFGLAFLTCRWTLRKAAFHWTRSKKRRSVFGS
jgi:hypothetical protein